MKILSVEKIIKKRRMFKTCKESFPVKLNLQG